jgi:hypothetical protein
MNKSTKKSGWVLPMAAMTILNVFVLGLAAIAVTLPITSCDNGTNSDDIARDVPLDIPGYNISVNCKPSQDELKDKISRQIDNIIHIRSGGDIDTFKNYVAVKGLTIIIEDYVGGDDYKIDPTSDNSFIIRSTFVSQTHDIGVEIKLTQAVDALNIQHHVVLLSKQFNNICMAHLDFQRPHRHA